MRKDMAKVVTEAPRRGHANPSSKWGRRLTKDEYSPLNRLLCYRPERRWASRGTAFLNAQVALRVFGIPSSTAQDIRRYRVDGLRVWGVNPIRS